MHSLTRLHGRTVLSKRAKEEGKRNVLASLSSLGTSMAIADNNRPSTLTQASRS